MTTCQSRTQFESWYQHHFGHSLYLETSESGVYLSPATGNLFAAFCAGSAGEAHPVNPEVAKLVARLDREQESFLVLAEAFVRRNGRASISAVQRHFKIGYNQAARAVEALEQKGVVSSIDSEGRRHVLPKEPADD